MTRLTGGVVSLNDHLPVLKCFTSALSACLVHHVRTRPSASLATSFNSLKLSDCNLFFLYYISYGKEYHIEGAALWAFLPFQNAFRTINADKNEQSWTIGERKSTGLTLGTSILCTLVSFFST